MSEPIVADLRWPDPDDDDSRGAKPPPDSPVMTVEQFGALLGIKRARAAVLASSGLVPTLRIGTRVYVPRAFLDTLAAEAIAAWKERRDACPSGE